MPSIGKSTKRKRWSSCRWSSRSHRRRRRSCSRRCSMCPRLIQGRWSQGVQEAAWLLNTCGMRRVIPSKERSGHHNHGIPPLSIAQTALSPPWRPSTPRMSPIFLETWTKTHRKTQEKRGLEVRIRSINWASLFLGKISRMGIWLHFSIKTTKKTKKSTIILIKTLKKQKNSD